jgi:type IX secretion system PorP/SprF family membrane protein
MKTKTTNKIKSIFFAFCVVLSGVTSIHKSFAQQDPQYSQYMFNTALINPAYVGSRDVLSLTALGRFQYLGLSEAPKTQTFSADMPILNEKMGVGLALFNDTRGKERTSAINIQYAYRLKLKKGVLAFGLQAGMQNYVSNLSSIKIRDNFFTKDPAFANDVNTWKPQVGAGLYYQDDKWFVGLSMPKFINYSLGSSNTLAGLRNHLFVHTGFVAKINEDLKLKPSVILKQVKGAPLNFDVNANLWIKDRIALGVSYRNKSAVVALLEMQANEQLRIGFAYDYALTPLQKYSTGGGSYELMIRYEFGYGSKSIVSPRYF